MAKVDMKVVLLGREFCGKTSLVERFLNERFAGENKYQNTIGAAYGARTVNVGGRYVVLGIWDTAGSERYESMSRMYYRKRFSKSRGCELYFISFLSFIRQKMVYV